MFSSTSKYRAPFWALMASYAVLCFTVPEILKVFQGQGPLAWIIGASPAYPIAAALLLYIRSLTSLDELEISIQLRALAVATGIILIAATAYGFLSLHLGLAPFPLIMLLPSFVLVWCLTGVWIRRGYQ